jgi:hypothetical protein
MSFMRYYGGRLRPSSDEGGRSCTPQEAFALIGNVGGDDTLFWETEIYPDARFVRACGHLGHVMEIVTPKYPGFLGRIYGDLDAGSTSSCGDPERILYKLHLSVDKLAKPENKLLEKALAIYATDQHTPIIGQWAVRVLSNLKYDLTSTMERLSQGYDTSNSLYIALTQGSEVIRHFQPDGEEEWMTEVWMSTLQNFDLLRFYQELYLSTTAEDFVNMGPFEYYEAEEIIEVGTENTDDGQLNEKLKGKVSKESKRFLFKLEDDVEVKSTDQVLLPNTKPCVSASSNVSSKKKKRKNKASKKKSNKG